MVHYDRLNIGIRYENIRQGNDKTSKGWIIAQPQFPSDQRFQRLFEFEH